MEEKKTFYITTPIYYPSDKLHIGHTYCTVAADTMAKYKRLRGFDVRFMTGADEHGQKIERIATAQGITPKEYVDKVVDGIKKLWASLDITYDRFIRTTDADHVAAVKKIFNKLYEKGDIYKSEYEGWYCTPCESFYTEHQLVDGKCPDCGRDVEKVKEESYFFRLSKYQDRLIKYIKDHPEFIQPPTRQTEMIANFLKPGLEDLCVSRTSFSWGIPVDFDPKHVIYVWVDALSNYITGLGYGSDDDSLFKKYWPADVHLVGKEIVRFHSIIWPAMLMALDLPLPKQVFGHGWLIINGGKMSKSKGNVVDPNVLIRRYGVDAVRYFLLREIAFGQDGNFTNEALIQRINSDLANDLGNLVSRTVGMIDKYFKGTLPEKHMDTEFDADLKSVCSDMIGKFESSMDKMMFSDALTVLWTFIRRTNKYIDETQPWILVRNEEDMPKLAGVLYNVAESIRIISIMLQPFMPNSPKAIFKQLCIEGNKNITSWESIRTFGLLPKALHVERATPLFPRIDMKKELVELEADIKAAQSQNLAYKAAQAEKEEHPEITIDDFAKVHLVTGEVLASEPVKGSKKLLKNTIKIGNETRTILSGIAKHYSPEEIIGKKVVVVENLAPRKMMGETSCGMILCAENEDGKLSLITNDKEFGSGCDVK
ncbi:MAG: methionine--tRNA ligase [Clostridia bacterium]|nr:methionine--tRNA ligase [Clostridia bacterium]MCI1999827.1 methionine--tRNA ligase [Clostridia bacterium]MCI2014257.1 methionine--tRNA ligase [Clostridia bacterium]